MQQVPKDHLAISASSNLHRKLYSYTELNCFNCDIRCGWSSHTDAKKNKTCFNQHMDCYCFAVIHVQVYFYFVKILVGPFSLQQHNFLLWFWYYSFGVRQTDDAELCQSIGIILHYLTLSTLLWMAVTVR